MIHTRLKKDAKRQLTVCIMLCCVPLSAQAIDPNAQDQLAAMQAVIDQQQSEISQQQSENKQQRSEIDQQRQALETQSKSWLTNKKCWRRCNPS
jgi:septal ring factor EnvC (AmiA/AmiB activator)